MSQDAREKARQIAAKQSKRGNVATNRRWIQLTVLGVVVVIVFVIGFVYINGQNNKVPNRVLCLRVRMSTAELC